MPQKTSFYLLCGAFMTNNGAESAKFGLYGPTNAEFLNR